jgi:cytochrome c biogenesis protein CcdA
MDVTGTLTFGRPEVMEVVGSTAGLLGLVSAVASACCTLPVLGAIVAYSGTRESSDKRTNLLTAAFLMLGTILALVILGVVAGYVGQVAQKAQTAIRIVAGVLLVGAGFYFPGTF